MSATYLIDGIAERAGRSIHREGRHVREDDVENILRADGIKTVLDGCLDRGDVLAPGEVSGGRRVDGAKICRRDGALAGVIIGHGCGRGVARVVHDQDTLVQRELSLSEMVDQNCDSEEQQPGAAPGGTEGFRTAHDKSSSVRGRNHANPNFTGQMKFIFNR